MLEKAPRLNDPFQIKADQWIYRLPYSPAINTLKKYLVSLYKSRKMRYTFQSKRVAKIKVLPSSCKQNSVVLVKHL